MARADEYEADKVASQLLGASVTAAALTEMVTAQLVYRQACALGTRFPAARLPVGPFAKLRKRLRSAPDASFSPAVLRTATPGDDVDDTHPVLRDPPGRPGQESPVACLVNAVGRSNCWTTRRSGSSISIASCATIRAIGSSTMLTWGGFGHACNCWPRTLKSTARMKWSNGPISSAG